MPLFTEKTQKKDKNLYNCRYDCKEKSFDAEDTNQPYIIDIKQDPLVTHDIKYNKRKVLSIMVDNRLNLSVIEM